MHGYMVWFYLWVANISMLFNVFTFVLIKVEIFLASQVLFDRGFSLANNMWQRWCKWLLWETSIYWEVHILSQWLLWLMYLNSWSPATGTVCGGCGIFGHGASLADRDIRVELECSRLHFGWVLLCPWSMEMYWCHTACAWCQNSAGRVSTSWTMSRNKPFLPKLLLSSIVTQCTVIVEGWADLEKPWTRNCQDLECHSRSHGSDRCLGCMSGST